MRFVGYLIAVIILVFMFLKDGFVFWMALEHPNALSVMLGAVLAELWLLERSIGSRYTLELR
jgi:hypothetical protein